MAVVVLPTPPFWFAMATIIGGRDGLYQSGRAMWRAIDVGEVPDPAAARRLHLVLAEIVRVEALQPLVETIGVGLLAREVDGLRVVDHRLLDVDRRARPQRQRDRVARARVDRHHVAVAVQRQVDERVEGVLLQVADDDLFDFGLQIADDVAQQIVGHRPRRRDVLDLQRDRVRLEDADRDREHLLPLLVAEDDDRRVRDEVDHQPLHGHLDLHRTYKLAAPAALSIRPQTECGPARSTRTGTVRPIHAAGPGSFTTTFVLVRPESSVSRRRLEASTSTATVRPTSASFSDDWISRCSACSATMRRVFSA